VYRALKKLGVPKTQTEVASQVAEKTGGSETGNGGS
jgi:hypothetical protein